MLQKETIAESTGVRSGYLTRALWFFLVLKLVYVALGLIWNPGSAWLSIFHRNDSAWYELIARQWYPSLPPQSGHESVFAFFPLYPLLLRLLMQFTVSYLTAAMLLNLVCGSLWIFLTFRLLQQRGWHEREIFRFLVFFQLLPFHHFLHVFYTESLFLLLLTGLLYFMERRQPAWVFFTALLLVLCRPTGLIYAATVPLLYFGSFEPKPIADWFRRSLPLLGAPIGLLLWMSYLQLHCGDARAFSHAQSGWDRAYTWPWEALFNQGTGSITALSVYSIFILLLAGYWLRHATWPTKLFHAINLLFPLITGQVISYPRYISANLPLFHQMRNGLNSRYFAIICVLVASLHIIVFYAWVMNIPVWSY